MDPWLKVTAVSLILLVTSIMMTAVLSSPGKGLARLTAWIFLLGSFGMLIGSIGYILFL